MPKKTRREKILAKERKLKVLQSLLAPTRIMSPDQEKASSSQDVRTSTSENDQNRTFKNYFIADLKKSLFYIGIIIALEIAMYFGTI